MKVSIITAIYNGVKTIEDCIKGIANQTYPDIEHIIIDGCSTDGTQEIIEKYNDKIAKLISEPDKGIYDGMNKGINLATGDVVGILNSDDLYAADRVIEIVIEAMREKNADCCWGDLVYVNREDTNKIIRYWRSSEYRDGLFKTGWMPPHPTFFVKKKVYEKYGLFDLDYSISADYEIMLRFLEKYKIRGVYIPKILVKMRTGGSSRPSFFNTLKANIKCYRAWSKNGLYVSPLLVIKKPLSKIKQFKLMGI